MSTAAPAKHSGGYSVSKPLGKCSVTSRAIQPGEKFMAMVKETPAGLERHDFTLEAWEKADKTDALAFWQSVMPQPGVEKKKPFVDDEVLCDLFDRLSETTEPTKRQFRFVLGLILMRKRLLTFEASETRDGVEYWQVRLKGRDARLEMENLRLTQEQIQEVSQQLGQIMNEEL
mgnify:CR=1 FL=1|jgi:hypothetical protein